MYKLFAATLAVTLWGAANAAQDLSTTRICNLLSKLERGKHVGQTITFSGDYGSDIERAVAWPDGCRWGVGVRNISPEAGKGIDRFQGHPITTVHGIITGTLTRVRPNGFELYKDDGVRLDIIRLAHPGPGRHKL